MLITETHHGFVCANSGVDQSSSGAAGRVVLLPERPRRVGRGGIRGRFAELGVDVAVIVSDTFGRPWREGQTDVAIGIAGIAPMHSYIGQVDPHGHEFRVQELCVVDELAGAAELVKGNTVADAGRRHPRLRLGARRHGVDRRRCSATPRATSSADRSRPRRFGSMTDRDTALTVELLQTLIRNECVNDGTPDSGEEVRNADLLQTYLEGAGLDVAALRRSSGAHVDRRPHRGLRPDGARRCA